MLRPTLYQPFITDAHKKHISSIATAFDASQNTAPNQREYELFKNLFDTHEDDPTTAWGLVSWKFNLKTPVPIEEFYEFAAAKIQDGYDGVFINPMIANEALFANVWEQGIITGHSGMEAIVNFLAQSTPNIRALMGHDCFAFCNYFIGSQKFWAEYFEFVEQRLNQLESEAEKQSEVGKIYAGHANYGKDGSATMRPFIIERLLSTFIASGTTLNISEFAFNENHYVEKFGKKLGSILWRLSQLKNEAFKSNSQARQLEWDRQRKAILGSQASLIALHADDAPEIYLELNAPAVS